MSFLLPTTRTTVSQGQTDEFAVTSSEYGRGITKVYGVDRISGNVIWADNIREERVEDVQTSGGKGSPKQETTTVTFRYYVDLAISFGEGPAIELRRLWADGKIIYDATTSPVERMAGLVFTTYLGTEEQEPDPIIEASVGVNNTPAYRGQVYLVFNDLPLENFGNRIPAITAEIAYSDTTVTTVPNAQEVIDDAVGVPNNVVGGGTPFTSFPSATLRSVRFNDETNEIVIDATTDGNGSANIRVDLDNNAVIAVPAYPAALFNGDSSCRGVIESTREIIGHPIIATGGSQDEAFLFDGTTGAKVREYDSRRILDGTGWYTFANRGVVGLEQSSGDVSVIGYACVNLDKQAEIGSITRPAGFTVMQMYPGRRGGAINFSTFEAMGAWVDEPEIRIVRCLITDLEGGENGQANFSVVGTITPGDVVSGATEWSINPAIVPDRTAPIVYIQTTIDSQAYCFAYRWDTDTILWSTQIPFRKSGSRGSRNGNGGILGTNYGAGTLSAATSLNGGFWVWSDGTDKICAINLSTGTLDGNLDGSESIVGLPTLTSEHWHGPTNTFVVSSNNSLWTLSFSFSVGDVNIREVITDICRRANVPSANIDVQNVPTFETGVRSYILENRIQARDALRPLLQLLQIDALENDGDLEFISRGTLTSSLSLTEDDLLLNEQGQTYLRPRLRDTELPLRFEVQYRDAENQYQSGVQADEREASAVQTVEIKSLEYPGAMVASTARNFASTLLFEAWSERERLTFRLPPSQLAVNPADIVTITLDTAEQVQLRIRTADLGANLEVDAEGVVQSTGIFVDAGLIGDTGSGNQVTLPSNVGDSSTFIFDTPLLRDADAGSTGQTNAYWSGSGEPTWNGVVLYRETGDTLVENVAKQIAPIPFGTVATALPDATRFSFFDETNSLVINVTRGAELFTTITELDVLSGGNVLLVVKANGETEFLQFQNVSVDAGDPNRLTLSKIIRGVRGTDTMANGMAAGDAVYLMLNSTYVNAFKRDASTINTAINYTGVTVGQFFEDAEPQSFTDTGRDLKPYAPAWIDVTQPGGTGTDLVFTWIRRTRIGGNDDFGNGVLDVPLSEDSESYDLVIYTDNTYTTEQRVINVSSETATYTSSQITADGDPSMIYFRIFQRSAQVGRGFASDQSTPRDL